MRDVSTKINTLRTAKAAATLHVSPATIRAIKTGNVPKADPIAVARVAGIQGAKQTSLSIPYCHQVPLDFVSVDIELGKTSIEITTSVKAVWKTGVEMEALTAASTAALTLYDMLKIIDEKMEIGSIRLLEKTGGKSASRKTGEGHSAAVIVLSDSVSRKAAIDRSGKLLVERLKELKFRIAEYVVLPDERSPLKAKITALADSRNVDLIVTTGGTGLGPRDITPETTLALVDKRLEGVEELFRSYGSARKRTAMLTRGIVGVRGKTIIINLPGATTAVEDGMNALFPSIIHSFAMLRGEGHGPVQKKKK